MVVAPGPRRLARLIVALAITRLPGDGGHVPAKGLGTGGLTNPIYSAGRGSGGASPGSGSGWRSARQGPLLAIGLGLAVLAIGLTLREMASRRCWH